MCGLPSSHSISSRKKSPSRSKRRSPSPSRKKSPSRSKRRSPSPSRKKSPSRSQKGSTLPLIDQEIYCGNNARDEGLVNRSKKIGSRYECLRKGVGKGLKEPILSYTEEYEPIDKTRIFCGNGDILPQNKDRLGKRDECMRIGFAVGQKQKYRRDGGIQRGPAITEANGWYKVYLPSSALGGR